MFRKLNLLDFIMLCLIVFFIFFNIHLFKENLILQDNNLSNLVTRLSGRKINLTADYNIYLLISPLDCQECTKKLVQKEFINQIRALGKEKALLLSINYVITGDYTDDEKVEFISAIKNDIEVYIDRKNRIKDYILRHFGTMRTPFVIVFPRVGPIKFWDPLYPDEKFKYHELDKKILFYLGALL